MDLHERLGGGLEQRRHAPCLITGLVLRQHAACREIQRVLVIWFLAWRTLLYGMKVCPAVRSAKAVEEQPGRAWMAGVRAGPEQSVAVTEPVVGDAGIVSHSAR